MTIGCNNLTNIINVDKTSTKHPPSKEPTTKKEDGQDNGEMSRMERRSRVFAQVSEGCLNLARCVIAIVNACLGSDTETE